MQHILYGLEVLYIMCFALLNHKSCKYEVRLAWVYGGGGGSRVFFAQFRLGAVLRVGGWVGG